MAGFIVTFTIDRDENVYSHIGELCALSVGVIWLGYRHGIKSWAMYEADFAKNGAARFAGAPVPANMAGRGTPAQSAPPAPGVPARYYIHANGNSTGPFLIDQVKSMWAMGLVTADAVYSEEGTSGAYPVSDLIGREYPPDGAPAAEINMAEAPRPKGLKLFIQRTGFFLAVIFFTIIALLAIMLILLFFKMH